MRDRHRVLRTFTRGILECIEREKTILERSEEGLKRWKKISPHMNKLKGAALISCVSFVESEVSHLEPVPFPFPKSVPKYSGTPRIGNLDLWRHKFDSSGNRWYGWEEFVNFHRIRHCFAHKNGLLLKGHASHITSFQKKLKQGTVKDRNGKKLDSYYDISSQKEIMLKATALERLRILSMEFLILSNVEGPITLNTGEIVSF